MWMFSATLRCWQRAISWWTKPMPISSASWGLRIVDRPALQQHLARVRLVHAPDDVHQGGLAGPVLADDGVHLAGGEGQVDVRQRLGGAEALADVADFQDRMCPCLAYLG